MIINSFRFAGPSGPALTFDEGFEASGYDEPGWTESGSGTKDKDYATSPSPLSGSKSLYLTGNGYIHRALTGSNHYWRFRFYVETEDTYETLFQFGANYYTNHAQLAFGGAGQIYINVDGNQSAMGSYTVGQEYFAWMELERNTAFRVYLSTTGVKPASPTFEDTTNVPDVDSANLRIGDGTAIELHIDDVQSAASPLGDF